MFHIDDSLRVHHCSLVLMAFRFKSGTLRNPYNLSRSTQILSERLSKYAAGPWLHFGVNAKSVSAYTAGWLEHRSVRES